ncbi:MAG: HlyD family efflux transporter periplasmic adaptor subunit [Pirellulaceae bacterium]
MSKRLKSQPPQGRVVLTVLILLGVLAGGGYAYYSANYGTATNNFDEIITDVVMRGPFDHIVLEQGEVESSSNIDVNCQIKTRGSGGTSILWVIEEGAYVKEGDKLVELDSAPLETEVTAQRISVSSAEATVISSQAAVRTAEISLQEYLEGTYQSERKTILSEVALSQQELRKAELSLESQERLAAKGVIQGLQVEAAEFAVVNAKNKLDAAEAKLRVLDELTKEKNKVQFESDIEAAKAKLKSDENVLLEEKSKLAETEDQIAKCIMLSPAEGVVVYNNKFSSRGGAEFVVEEGASVRERQTIIKLPDPNKMQVKADVNESRITLINPGMAAKVKVGAVPGQLLARVVRVNKYAEPGSWFSSSVKEYATIIEIIDPPETIRTGMTAEVQIFVAQLPDALQIPVHGVYEYKGHHFCLKKDGPAAWSTAEIEIGATNDKMVTIESGLGEGDEIALNPRNHLNLMELPEVEDVTDREKLKEIGKEAGKPAAAVGATKPATSGGAPAGRGGSGGGFNPSVIVDAMFAKSDTDGDGKIAGDEINTLDSRMKDGMSRYDSNGDGALEKAEVMKVFKSFSNRGGGGGGGGGGRGGPPGR